MSVYVDITNFGETLSTTASGVNNADIVTYKLSTNTFLVLYTRNSVAYARIGTANAGSIVYSDEILINSIGSEIKYTRISDTKFGYAYKDTVCKCGFFYVEDGEITLGEPITLNTVEIEDCAIVGLNDEYSVVAYSGPSHQLAAVVVETNGLTATAGVVNSLFIPRVTIVNRMTGIRLSDTKMLFTAAYSYKTAPSFILEVIGGVVTKYTQITNLGGYDPQLFNRDDGGVDEFYETSNTAGTIAYRKLTINDDNTITVGTATTVASGKYSGSAYASKINSYSYLVTFNSNYEPAALIANISRADGSVTTTSPVILSNGQCNHTSCIVLSDELVAVQYSKTGLDGFYSVPLTIALTGDYEIDFQLTNVLQDENNLQAIPVRGDIDLIFYAEDGWVLPLTVEVYGASYEWDAGSGTLRLYAPFDYPIIKIVGLSDQSVVILNLYKNSAEPNRVDKADYLEKVGTIYGVLREEMSVMNPVIRFEMERIPEFNYVSIGLFDRYYFLEDLVAIRHKFWEMSLSVDVLMSFKTYILSQTGFVERNENDFNPMLIDNIRAVEQGKQVQILKANTTFIDPWSATDERADTVSSYQCRYVITGTALTH